MSLGKIWQSLSRVANPMTYNAKLLGMVDSGAGKSLGKVSDQMYNPIASSMVQAEDAAAAEGALGANDIMSQFQQGTIKDSELPSVYGDRSSGGLNAALGGDSVWGGMMNKKKAGV